MKRILLILVLQSAMLTPALAQFDTPEKISVNQVHSKALLVETQEEVTRTLMDLRSSPEKQKAYKDGVANYNRMIKEVVEKYYKFGNKPAEFMPASEVQKLVEEKKAGKYAILHFSIENGNIDPMDIGPIYGGKYNDSVRDFSRSKGYGMFSIQLPGYDKTVKNVYSVSFPVAYPSEADMIYAIQMIHNVFTKVLKVRDYQVNDFRDDITKYNKRLKYMTLMIEKGQVKGKTTIEDLRKDYKGPIEIDDYEKIDDAVINGDSLAAYVMVVPVKANATTSGILNVTLRHLVIEAKDGIVLGYAKPHRMEYGKIAPDITRKEVKEYME